MGLLDKINADLKQAMLASEQETVSVLRGIKTAIQYEGLGKPVSEMDESTITKILQKESKKRSEASELYSRGGGEDRAAKELREKSIIDSYLPEMLVEEEVITLINQVIEEQALGLEMKNMGLIIKGVNQKAEGKADSSQIAQLVKKKIEESSA